MLVVSITPGASKRIMKGKTKVSNSDQQCQERKVPLTATHELRLLRREVAQLQDELLTLNSKWEEQIPDPMMLHTARQAVKEKWQANQVEQLSAQLHGELAYQQFVVATLQSRFLQSPLFSNDQQLYSSIHEQIRLGRDPAERAATLESSFQRTIRKLPNALASSTRGIIPSVNPYSQTRVTGARDHTLVSSIFVAEIPHASFQDMFDATLSYFAALPDEMERHTGTSMHTTELQHFGDYLDYSRIRYASKAIESTGNYATGVSVVDGIGVFFIDAIDHDELYPNSSEESVATACSALTITPTTDEATGGCKMVLRRVLVARYNLSPEAAAVQENTKLCTPIANGDLLIATVVRFLQQQQ
uniref:START domain-containing protein n=1 Tax=Globisporangium ultimum (strain ATCC 200006 / CBS 805.95 / DAOM BR144) TaxID=431595 RepID=K3X3D6_GLOUD